MYTLTNNIIAIKVAAQGAELQSIYHIQNNLEYMWSGNPAYWGKKSPVLFPIVGELKDKKYRYQGNEYQLSRHGFAREMEFAVTAQTKTSITFSIKSSNKTLDKYPFQFSFSIKYSLQENILSITYIVENKDNKKMFFSVGGHPAFKVPLMNGTAFDDYYLLLEQTENVGRYPITPDGLIDRTPTPLITNTNKIPLTKNLFSKDALVFKELQSKTISIVSDKTIHGLKVSFEGFPYMGIWSTKGADFVCIEPWCGIADTVDATGKLEEKEGIQSLNPGEVFNRTFIIEVF